MTHSTSSEDQEPQITAPRHYFTLAEANRALVLVKRIAEDIQSIELQRRTLVHQTASSREQPTQEQAKVIESKFDTLTEQLGRLIEELAAIGVQLKDPTRGLVDFPSRFNDRTILLCWQIGEPSISYWHDIATGFSGRRSVRELEPQPQPVG